MVARAKCSFLFVLALALGNAARGQVVNVESRRFMNDTVPWTGFANFRFNVSESGQRSLNLGLNGAVQHLDGRHRWMFINDLAFSQVEANDFVNTGFQHLRYNYRRDSMWTGEVFAQSQYNKPLKLDLRLSLGAGPRLTALNTQAMQVNIGTAVMVERETVTRGPVQVEGRSTSYVAATLKFSSVASLTAVAYYQPRLFDASDHRVALEGAFLVHVTKRITLESRMNLLRDTAPAKGVPGLTYSWNNMFGIRF